MFDYNCKTMNSLKTVILLCCMSGTVNSQQLVTRDLSCEHASNPVGIGNPNPRLSWKISGTGNDILQSAYEIVVAAGNKFSPSRIVWQSGKVQSDESILQPYAGKALKSGQVYYWKVRVWDNKGRVSGWSSPAFFETGLLSPSDMKAGWIEMKGDTNQYSPSPYFRKEFTVGKKISRAVVYVTSHGFYELHLNGVKVGDQVLTPGWTSYNKRLQYQVYDVTGMIARGNNAIGAILGDGWYRCMLGWTGWAHYGKRTGLLVQLRITHDDGSESLVVTDDTWKCTSEGPVRMNDIYNGEVYDATRELTGWDRTGFNDAGWQPVIVADYPYNLVAMEGVPVRKIEELKPVKIFRSPKGSLLVDMGQNMVGWIRLKATGARGTVITVRHAEVLDKQGEFYTKNLRSAKCQLVYTMSGNGEEVYEPRFTFMGFRYAEITGYPGELTPDKITGIVVHSDMKPTGSYECSNPLINRLQKNIQWGQKGNFVDIPTDCPQRDERLGWTGDAQAFSRTAAFNFDVSAFFIKWLKDLALDQKPGGEVPDVIPDILNKQNATTAAPSAGWADAAVIIPWTMYTVYGDKKFLENQYASMKAWVDYIRNKAGSSHLWKGGSKYGDWLFYHPPVRDHKAPDGYTEPDFIATAFYAHSVSLLSRAAEELGKTEDAAFYKELFNQVKEVFNREYVTPAGRVGTNSQTSYILAIKFNLLPDELVSKAAGFLVADIKARKNHLSTGFLGTPFINHILSGAGYGDVGYDLLCQETYPSWLYPVKMGATTIWERWDGIRTDSTMQDPGMNSFNHYSYGAIGDWMYRVSAGIEAGKPGYKEIIIQPLLTRRLDYSKAGFESQYGTIASGWQRKEGKIQVNITIPANTTATIVLPCSDIARITENGAPLVADKRAWVSVDNGKDLTAGKTRLQRGSGNYMFEFPE
jgi:alpha-L-rhamnosidase